MLYRLSYGHKDDGWNRTSFQGGCSSPPRQSASSSKLAERGHSCWWGGHSCPPSFKKKHAVQGSNLPPLGLEPRIPPLKNFRRVLIFTSMRREGLEPPQAMGQQLYRLPQLPLCHLRSCRSGCAGQVSVEGFEPSTPCARGTCAAKLRYTLKMFPQHSRRDSNSRWPAENRQSCRLDDGSSCSAGF